MGQVHFFDLLQAIILTAAFGEIYGDTLDHLTRESFLEAMAIDGARGVIVARTKYLLKFGKAA